MLKNMIFMVTACIILHSICEEKRHDVLIDCGDLAFLMVLAEVCDYEKKITGDNFGEMAICVVRSSVSTLATHHK